jgi:O-antigen/teichoic acid export membrane protein
MTGPSGTAEVETEARSERFDFTGSLRVRAARGTIINTAFTVALGGLALLQGFILAGFISRSDYGIWGVIAASLSTLVWLKQAGVGDKFVQQDEADQEAAFQKALTLELVLTLGCVVLIAVALPVLVAIYNLPELVAPSVVIAVALLVSVLQAPQWIYYRKMDFVRQRALAAISPVVGFVVAVGMAIAGAGYWSFVGGLTAGAICASVAAVAISPYKIRLRYDRGTLRSYWSFSGPLLLAGAAGFVMVWSAVITAKLSLGIAAVGTIALAENISSFTDSVDQLVTGTLYPAICAVRDRPALLYESLVKSNRLALTWAVPFGVGVSLFAADLVQFGIGERWHSAVLLLEVFGVTAAINHVGFNWTAYFRALNRTRPLAVVNVAATVAFLVVGIPLLLLMGLPGFAIGIAFQAFVALVLRVMYLHEIFPGFGFLAQAARAFLPTVPAAALVLLVRVVESGTRTLPMALGELAAYVLLVIGATWYFESSLLREAVGLLSGRRTAPVA